MLLLADPLTVSDSSDLILSKWARGEALNVDLNELNEHGTPFMNKHLLDQQWLKEKRFSRNTKIVKQSSAC